MSDVIENRAVLTSIIERIESLRDDRKNVSEDIREVYKESKGQGFDNRVIRKLVQLRAQDKAERIEMNTMLDLYAKATGTTL